jgi:hypothetical protein
LWFATGLIDVDVVIDEAFAEKCTSELKVYLRGFAFGVRSTCKHGLGLALGFDRQDHAKTVNYCRFNSDNLGCKYQ